jgi:GAF domain-containing protein
MNGNDLAADHPMVAEGRRRALDMLEQGASQRDILPVLVVAAEKANGGNTVSSILVLDREGLLRNGASPKLPQDYLEAIDGLKPDPGVGTCAAAAATGSVVLTPDFRADEKWAELRHLPLALGYLGAWSQPIIGANGAVLGTFGTYFREMREPREEERRNVAALAATAGIVIDRCRERRLSG